MKTILLALFITWQLGCFAQEESFKISAEDFYSKIKKEQSPQILDARSEEEYEQAHFPEAIQIDQKSDDFSQKVGSLDHKRPVFIYSIQTGRSSRLAEHLSEQSFKEVYVLSPGISAWVGSGYPLVVSQTNNKRVTLQAFKDVLASNDYVLVNYGSNYCAPCKKVVPVLDSLRSESTDLKIFKIEIDVNPDIIKENEIKTIPTTILYKSGNPVWAKTGIPTVDEIRIAKNEN
ncbi:sulfurtransferase [Sphingobacterium olei]|uniref:Sulfurtransferase n=1 Tax=Sphingobacterium olei TaxID=2571155 RepID=A0A4U0P1Y5_9SPHI|nr:thioredoxin domain-containing protein [Sphingobacterium olei]TJZ61090.1 sulfurtransferase [Sphingobacterium olei]